MARIAKKWKELSGKNKWEGLMTTPLDGDLCRYILHYGEMAGATYDAFGGEKLPDKSLKCPKKDFFSEVGLEKGHPFKYEVKEYLYAVERFACFKEKTWIGYVAVATDEGMAKLGRRDIVIAWRGTQTLTEAIMDVYLTKTQASNIFKNQKHDPQVHFGFQLIYTSPDKKGHLNTLIKELVDHYTKKGEEVSITLTGHSLGAALATLNAVDIVENEYNKPKRAGPECMVTAIVFASPRVGDSHFKKRFDDLVKHHAFRLLRITNSLDMVPHLPSFITGFSEVGIELKIYTLQSPFLKEITSNSVPILDTLLQFLSQILRSLPKNLAEKVQLLHAIFPILSLMYISHNLELYLHGVALVGNLQGERDRSLLNKTLNILKEEFKIPPNWWSKRKEMMIQWDDGIWKPRIMSQHILRVSK